MHIAEEGAELIHNETRRNQTYIEGHAERMPTNAVAIYEDRENKTLQMDTALLNFQVSEEAGMSMTHGGGEVRW